MAKFGENIKKRMDELKKKGENIEKAIIRAQTDVTIRAVEKAAQETPVDTGQLQAHWGSDSTTTPKKYGNKYTTELANNIGYASYINNGHRVRGKSGKRTKGKYMQEQAVKLYKELLPKLINENIEKLVKN